RGPAPTKPTAKSLIIMTNRLWQGLQTNIKPRGLSRGDWIRTSDPLVPNQVRYRTALRPELLIKSRKNRTRRIPILRRLKYNRWDRSFNPRFHHSSRFNT